MQKYPEFRKLAIRIVFGLRHGLDRLSTSAVLVKVAV